MMEGINREWSGERRDVACTGLSSRVAHNAVAISVSVATSDRHYDIQGEPGCRNAHPAIGHLLVAPGITSITCERPGCALHQVVIDGRNYVPVCPVLIVTVKGSLCWDSRFVAVLVTVLVIECWIPLLFPLSGVIGCRVLFAASKTDPTLFPSTYRFGVCPALG